MPKVVIVVLNWNGKNDTIQCLISLHNLNYRDFEIVVVDNGSTDGSVDAIREKYKAVHILETGTNLGYAGGNNVGIKWALDHHAHYVLLLNNDTIVASNLISAFVEASALLPTNSVLGAKIFYYDKPDTLWFAGGRWDDALYQFQHIGYGRKDSAEFAHMSEVDYITGCALFASSAIFKEVGLLDERFFLTYEETDWCYRAKKIGHKCIFVPEAKLWHKVSSSFGGADSPLVGYFMQRNRLLWIKKHLPRQVINHLHKENLRTLRRILLPPLSLPKTNDPLAKRMLWSLSIWLKYFRGNLASPMNQATLFALRDYYLGRFGNCPAKVRELAQLKKAT